MKTFLLLLSCATAFTAPVSVRLESNLPSPQPVGTVIGLMPRVEHASPGLYVYRYAVSTSGGPFRVTRDFSQEPDFAWSPELFEHEARVRVTARNNQTKDSGEAELAFTISPRSMQGNGIVTPTSNPLVALFSAPPCPQGSSFRVSFQHKDEPARQTFEQPCRGTVSNNVYVAGMRAESDYQMRAEIVNGGEVKEGSWIPFRTGMLNGNFPRFSLPALTGAGPSAKEGIIIRSMIDPWTTVATDLDANVVWYLSAPSQAFITRVLPQGRFLGLSEGANSVNDMKRWQLIRELNLAGNTLRETNIGRLAEQMESRGIKSDCKKGSKECVPGFHHEAIRLPNGHTLVLAGLERMFPAGTQSAKGPVDILGDVILDLDEDLQLAWMWNAFDHLDIKRASLGNEKCAIGSGNDGCTPIFLADSANGWLHSNALDYIPETGDLLLSVPEQDWVLKIDYRDGKGTGKILWRFGKDGDFTAKSEDPYPWFSYQHDAGFDPESKLLVLFDDGHRRKDKFPQSNNRGQAWKLDENGRTASLVLNADLGIYAVAVGSAQPLSNGGYSFECGFLDPGPAGLSSIFSRTVETSADGKVTYSQQADGALTYRSFRVPDLYTAPRK